MGQGPACTNCRCRCDCERECTQLFSILGCLAVFCVAPWLLLPYLWADPFDGSGDGSCDHAHVLPIAVSFPIVASILAFCFCIPCMHPTAGTLHGTIVFVVLVSLVMLTLAVILLVSQSFCEGDSKLFPLSVGLMFVVPTCPLWSPLLLICCSSCPLRRTCGSRRSVSSYVSVPRVPTAQKVLRHAMIWGDSFIVGLLLDIDGQARNPFWRCYRCVLLGALHCQLRPVCCIKRDQNARESRAARASLAYTYSDDASELPVHYLARGAFNTSASDALGRLASRRCCGRRHTFPEFTDRSRARILKKLIQNHKLSTDSLICLGVRGSSAMHSAASTGSYHFLIEALSQIGQEVAVFQIQDSHGNTPCDVALQFGYVECSYLLAGTPGDWPGLTGLQNQRGVVQNCTSDALIRLPPTDPSFAQAPPRLSKVHESSDDVLVHMNSQLADLKQRIGGNISEEAADALLRFHDFSVDAAAAAYHANPRAALDSAGLKSVPIGQSGSNVALASVIGKEVVYCMVCFENVPSGAACKEFACDHATCDDCLRSYLDVRLNDGDMVGIICPEPSCKVTISESMMQRLFGIETPQLQRFQVLRANKFVDSSGSSSWCPKPGCGRAVSVTGNWQNYDRGSVPPTPPTVTCTCKTKFCFTCKAIGGHEPVPCDVWKEWIADIGGNERMFNESASETWVQGNSRECTCGAQIQRSSGCNHMICTVCGRHFCYSCGKDWSLHRSQPGGFDHFVCRLNAPAGQDTTTRSSNQNTKAARLQEALPGWRSNTRDLDRQAFMRDLLLRIAELFDLDGTFQSVANAGFDKFMEARAVLQRCYVLKFQWSASDWRRRLDSLVGELEATTSALENVLGFSLLDTAMNSARVSLGHARTEEILKLLDLRQLVPRVIVVSEMSSSIWQVSTAVTLQTSRILDAGRMGFPEKQNPLLRAVEAASGGFHGFGNGRRQPVRPAQAPLIDRCSLM